MSKLIDDYVDYLNKELKANSVYIWGAQGQRTLDLTVEDIKKMDSTDPTGKSSTQIVLNFIGKCITAGKDMTKSRAFDCSGLSMYYLIANSIFLSDMTAEDLRKNCTDVGSKYRQKGDLVFVLNSAGKATHVGSVVDDDYVIESRGKDYGVVKYKFAERSWNLVGRPNWWEYAVTRELKLTSPYMKGNDVGQLQARLTCLGYPCGTIDDVFGSKTQSALIKAQKALVKGRYAEGVLDEKTTKALGFMWSVDNDRNDK